MNEKLRYPKTLDELKELISFQYQILVPENKNKLISWEKWFQENHDKLSLLLTEDQYLKIFYEDNKKSLQVWKKENDYEILEYNLLSNYIDEFSNDKTIITK